MRHPGRRRLRPERHGLRDRRPLPAAHGGGGRERRRLGADCRPPAGHVRRGHAVATRLAPTRYDRVVEALGGKGEHVDDPADLVPALERAFASGTVYCVDVAIDPEAAAAAGRRRLRHLTGRQATMAEPPPEARPRPRGDPGGRRAGAALRRHAPRRPRPAGEVRPGAHRHRARARAPRARHRAVPQGARPHPPRPAASSSPPRRSQKMHFSCGADPGFRARPRGHRAAAGRDRRDGDARLRLPDRPRPRRRRLRRAGLRRRRDQPHRGAPPGRPGAVPRRPGPW